MKFFVQDTRKNWSTFTYISKAHVNISEIIGYVMDEFQATLAARLLGMTLPEQVQTPTDVSKMCFITANSEIVMCFFLLFFSHTCQFSFHG
jgi:hypothetical protein